MTEDEAREVERTLLLTELVRHARKVAETNTITFGFRRAVERVEQYFQEPAVVD